jgi:Iron-containing redox enzyme
VADRGTLAQLREFAIHRSAYQLKEADPHTWAIPRLTGAVKAAMVEIQADEYGDGRHCGGTTTPAGPTQASPSATARSAEC